MIEPGEMRYRAVFLRHDGTRDSSGRKAAAGWREVGSARVARRDNPTEARVNALGVDAVASSELRMRWNLAVSFALSTNDRAELGGQTYAILGIENLNQANAVAVLTITSISE